MLDWKLWEGDANQWDAMVCEFPDYTVFQSYAWGVHQERFGWRPLRLFAHDQSRRLVSLTQAFVRSRIFGVGVVWIPGGPLGDMSAWSYALRKVICEEAKLRFAYYRLNVMRKPSKDSSRIMLENGWRRSSKKLSSGLSLEYDPSPPDTQRMLKCSGNWRHNLRRSFKRCLTIAVWSSPNPHEIMQAYESMQKFKNIGSLTSFTEIDSISRTFGDRCLIVHCRDERGELLALRGALVMGSKAWDIFAVTSAAGRKVYASHAAFWELMSQCSDKGVNWYDLGGADPLNNRSVYDFKKGTGAADIEYLGEWECAHPYLLRHIANFFIGRRRHI